MLRSPWTAGGAAVCAILAAAASILLPARGQHGSAQASVAAMERGDQLSRTTRALKADRLTTTALALIRPAVAPATGPQVAALGYADMTAGSGAYAGDPDFLARILLDSNRLGMTLDPAVAPDGEADVADEAEMHAEPLPTPRAKPAIFNQLPVPQGDARKASLASLGGSTDGRPGPIRGSLYASLPTPAPVPPSRTMSPPARGSIPLDTPFGVPYIAQTETVETACLKPELIGILQKVEAHYGQKVVITSGGRSRGRDGSLHKSCSAADIIVPGVDATALASWARTIPGIGGVGSYCHPNMIHVDIGTPRDWKFGCGGSYFAMRDGSKVSRATTE